MRESIRTSLVLLGAFTVLTGVVYPLTTTLVAQLLFPGRASGSIVVVEDGARGSTLVGQPFAGTRYLVGRPSATAPVPYNSAASAGSQLGPVSPVLDSLIRTRVAEARVREGLASDVAIAADLVTASGSGLDPHLSPAAAALQVSRIATARAVTPDSVRSVLARATAPRWLGLIGEPRVNVLVANLLLDGVIAAPPSFR